jgi:hypothetical protein
MPPEPRRPAQHPPSFVPPPVPPPVQLGLTDILTHLIRNAEEQARVTTAARLRQGMDAARVDELNRRLANVRRLAGELHYEHAALEALRPPDHTGPLIT